MIYLERFTANTPFGVFGRLSVADLILYTVEQPWNENKPGQSCVPVGQYDLIPHSSAAHPDVWALENRALGVSHYPEAGIPRSAILIHTANRAAELRGCIAPGTGLGMVGGEWAVIESRDALSELRIAMIGEHQIEIRQQALIYETHH